MKNSLTLFVDNQQVELGVETIDLKLNLVNFNPIYTKSSQAEYSFSFSLPSTPINNKVFDYANNLSKKNKFKRRYNAKAYVGEILIFEGSLIINSYNAKTKTYKVNLVTVKVYNPEDIFGDDTLTDIKWLVDYQGASTINAINNAPTAKYKFPYALYGSPQKVAYYTDDVASDYTSKFIIDNYNRFWHNSFPPSLNVLELIKRAFEQYGYTVGGSAFNDPYLNNIFASYSISDEQDPIYNVGNEKFGRVNITNGSANTSTDLDYWTQSLTFPYRRVDEPVNLETPNTGIEEYNYSDINIWNILGNGTLSQLCYMYDPNEKLIIIPADGFYEIALEVNGTLDTSTPTFQSPQWYANYASGKMQSPTDADPHMVTFSKDLNGETPLEIQLIKNYNDDVELIKGRNNVIYYDGDPSHESVDYNIWLTDPETITNKIQWETDFPHQALYYSKSPTKEDSVTQSAVRNNTSNRNSVNAGAMPHYASTIYGYMHPFGKTMPYDSVVNPNFICGFSTMDNGQTVSVIKNGYSWDKGNATKINSFANVEGMERVSRNAGGKTITPTTLNENTYNNAPENYFNNSSKNFVGKVYCCVELKKGDKLELMAIQRDFNGVLKYGCTINYNLDIRAISPSSYAKLKENASFGYGYPTEFPYQLNLCNFTNEDTKISDWINDVQSALNLDITQDGYNITINSNKSFSKRKTLGLIDIDDRVSSFISDVETQRIDFPSKFAVQWNISEEEFGFVSSCPDTHINDDDWKDYCDSGYTVIKVSEDIWNTDEQTETVQFSYNWQYPFEYALSGNSEILNLSVIGNNDLYIDDLHDYNDAMSKDAYSDTQRFWYVNNRSNLLLPLASYGDEYVYITNTSNNYEDFYLSYKDTEKSLLTEYFNGSFINSSSNEVKLKDVIINPEEYKMLKGGCAVKFDKDLYLCEKADNYSYVDGMADLLLYK